MSKNARDPQVAGACIQQFITSQLTFGPQ